MLSLFSCMFQGHRSILIDENIIMELKIGISEFIKINQEEVPIFIELTNSSKYNYKVSSVKYWSNITIKLKKGNELIHGIKVKPDFSKSKGIC